MSSELVTRLPRGAEKSKNLPIVTEVIRLTPRFVTGPEHATRKKPTDGPLGAFLRHRNELVAPKGNEAIYSATGTAVYKRGILHRDIGILDRGVMTGTGKAPRKQTRGMISPRALAAFVLRSEKTWVVADVSDHLGPQKEPPKRIKLEPKEVYAKAA